MMQAKLVESHDSHDFYHITEDGREWWNIVKQGEPAPAGGYRSKTYIEKIKHVCFNGSSQTDPATYQTSQTAYAGYFALVTPDNQLIKQELAGPSRPRLYRTLEFATEAAAALSVSRSIPLRPVLLVATAKVTN